MQDITGTYNLLKFIFEKEDKTCIYPFGGEVAGLLSYQNNGYMSAQLGSLTRKNFKSPDYRNGKPDEIIESFNQYISYFGRYRVFENGTYIVHYVEQSMFPNWIGQNVKRYYEMVEENGEYILTLSTTPILYEDFLVTPKLIWKKNLSNSYV